MVYLINALDINTLRNAEYIQFGRDFLKIIFLDNKVTLKVATEYDAFDAILTVIESLFKTDQGSDLTPIIEALDKRRDSAVIGIFKNIDSFNHHFTPAQVAAAFTLSDYLKIYGTATAIAASSLPSETTIVKNMISDVTTKANLVAAVATLGLSAWFNELKAANDALEAKYIDRTIELGGANPNTIKDKRNEANNVYYALRDMLQGQALVDKGVTPVFAKAINELNALIEQYNTLLNSRAPEIKQPQSANP